MDIGKPIREIEVIPKHTPVPTATPKETPTPTPAEKELAKIIHKSNSLD